MADTTIGSTLAFGTSSFAPNYHSIDLPERIREFVRTSHLGTTGSHTYIPKKLTDNAEIPCVYEYDPDSGEPPFTDPETITITFPIPSGLTNGATLVGTGFVIRSKPPVLDVEDDLMKGEMTIKCSGTWTFTDAS